MPRVSVILPNYNYARYLKERMRSVLRQTLSDFEFLYLDDASTDASNEIAREFESDARLKLHLYQQNSGKVYQRWNDGAAMATGDWLWFAGADDSAHPSFLEKLLATADAHPFAGILHSQLATIDGGGRLLADEWPVEPELEDRMRIDHFGPGHEEAFHLTSRCFLATASAMLIRRDLFAAAGGFDVRLWSAADWHLYLSMLRTCDIAYCSDPLVYYRSHHTTVSKTTRMSVRGLEDAYCVAAAYLWMAEDDRYLPEQREAVLVRLKSRIFDMFADPEFAVPDHLQFAAELLYRAVPDKRLHARA